MSDRSSITRSTLEALLVAAATPVGLWLGWALTEPSSRLRIELDTLLERGRRLELELREAWIRRQAADVIAEAEIVTAEEGKP